MNEGNITNNENNDLQVGKSYTLFLEVNNNTLTFTCKVTKLDSDFIYFVDKFGKRYMFAKRYIVSIQELKKDKGTKEDKENENS